ncbi:spore coat protein F precursor [Clostridium saccharobutylicum]|uniref:Spore coat protein F-like protein YraD n=2 Tax=Clostridium saccharobutylicum TaxID=169679 RepID=U5MTD6_CLOSA|nr:spore coat protein [Clostridium saccharobutylicum]AGX43860.1 spore coat protein F-like protein YraD [Clostridium saccharobutylicum DSM 13864]AQR91161.1 spore coat protein F precursor [Clostridium saccharobutylicum]AQS01065.1 spore coat protein F precursor [Clostridium saccharobutylicum]AQS10800.1 spore coat protein F precursor [Clostridium saccharobutylicum]AQS15048.1 spore coat protein F precursor [Clostridium saccharobutylicum]
MNGLIETLTGMDKMTDQVIATDFLISAKSGVQNYAVAITETTSPEVRLVLRKQLEDAIVTHDKISNYMMEKGYYHAYNMQEQLKVDINTTDVALNLVKKFK